MFESRSCAVLLLSLLAVPCAAVAQQQPQQEQQPACATTIPGNVDAGFLASDMLALLRRSDTFRSQCARIAAEPRVRVRIAISNGVDGGARAQTTLRRFGSASLQAEVEVQFGENYRELLAHEFEHVIEQMDGVDLRQEAVQGRAWEIASGTFETRRACLVGVQVLREAEALPLHAAAVAPVR
jgi:hypothetical protein